MRSATLWTPPPAGDLLSAFSEADLRAQLRDDRRDPWRGRSYAPMRNRSYQVGPDGRIRVDPAKKHVVPFWLTTEPEKVSVPAATDMGTDFGGFTALAGGTSDPIALPIDNKGPFEIVYSSFRAKFTSGPDSGTPTDQFTVVIFDPEYRPVLMNREVHARTIGGGFGSALGAGFGTAIESAAGRPLVWPETWFLEPTEGGKCVFIGFRNLTLETIEVRWAFHGVRYYHLDAYEEALREKEALYGKGRVSYPYFYTTEKDVVLGAGATSGEFDLRVTDDADVEIFKMTHFADNAFLWRVQEKAGKRFLDNAGLGAAGAVNGVHSDFGWGDAEFPFIPFETMYYEQNFKLMMVFFNLTGIATRIFPTLVCRKIAYAKP